MKRNAQKALLLLVETVASQNGLNCLRHLLDQIRQHLVRPDPLGFSFEGQDDTVTEGRNRMIRRMMAYLGHHVMDLRRQRFAGVDLGQLRLGQIRELTEEEVAGVRKLAEKRKAKA